MNFTEKNITLLFFLTWAFLLFAGCSIPQIIVLKDPLTAQEYLRLGVSYESRNQLDLAEAQYRKASDQGIPEAFLFLGNIAYQKKNYKDAVTFYHKAIKKMPEDPRAYNNLAWLYYEQGTDDLNKAENMARKALELAPSEDRSAYTDTLEKILLARKKINLSGPKD
jgi:tetratricopeptide (TPR) repeat protein